MDGQARTWIGQIPEGIEVLHILGQSPTRLWVLFDTWHERLRYSKLGALPLLAIDRIASSLYKGKVPRYRIEEWKDLKQRALFSHVPESLFALPLKEFSLFHYFLYSTNHTYLYLTNTSSYVRLDLLLRDIQRRPESKQYLGTINDQGKFRYASGSNRLLSRDLVTLLYHSRSHWDFSSLDDVSMGRMLANNFIKPDSIPSCSLDRAEDIELLTLEQLEKLVHYRLKADRSGVRIDSELMWHLHDRITTMGSNPLQLES